MIRAKRRKGKFDIDYWAAGDDPVKLAEECYERIRTFYESVRSSFYWSRIARNWLYYHGLYFEDGASFDWTAVKQITDTAVGVGVNQFRSLLENIYTIITQQRLALQARAKQGDTQSLEQAKIAKNVVDHYRREVGLEERLKRAVRHALVLTSGFVHAPWDVYGGEQDIEVPATDEMGQLILDENGVGGIEAVAQGDFSFSNPTIWDVVFDPGVREWERNTWVMVRTYENKYDLAAQQEDEETAKKVLDADLSSDEASDTLFDMGYFGNYENTARSSDVIPVWNFYHRRTAACPGGRAFRLLGDALPLGDANDLDYERIPVFRIVPGETLMTQLGYSPANDLQGPQELLNAETSMIASNHLGAGNSIIWAPGGCKLAREDLGEGVIFLEGGDKPPAGISLQANNPDHERFVNMQKRNMEEVSGINSVARGQPEANLKSGEALKVMDAKATQSASALKESYVRCTEDLGTHIVRTFRDEIEGDHKRLISIAGEQKVSSLGYFTPNDLAGVDRIIVDVANPTTDTISGKMWVAEQLLQRGMITTAQEFLTVAQTGNLDPLTHADEEQLTRIHSENDFLSRGLDVPVLAHSDNHVLDIREHAALLSRPEVRQNGEIFQNVASHMGLHYQALMDPYVQWCLATLGFPAPPPIMPVGQGIGAPRPPVPQNGSQGGQPQAAQKIQGPGEPPKAGAGGDMGQYPKAVA